MALVQVVEMEELVVQQVYQDPLQLMLAVEVVVQPLVQMEEELEELVVAVMEADVEPLLAV